MYKYETIVIMKPNITEEEKQKELDDYKALFEGYSNKDVSVEDIGKKILAYEVKGNKEGNFAIFNYSANFEDVAEAEKKIRDDEKIIKFISVRHEQELEQENEDIEDDEMEV